MLKNLSKEPSYANSQCDETDQKIGYTSKSIWMALTQSSGEIEDVYEDITWL